MTGRFGLIGEKLGHSWSVPIHELLFKKLGMNGEYTLYPMPINAVPDFIESVGKPGGLTGLNVTIPYKEQVIPYLHRVTYEAEAIGAVNTIRREDGKLVGYNTDYFGFRSLLERNGVTIDGEQVLVLGSGGSARTVAACLRDMAAEEILLVSRNPQKAVKAFDGVKVIGYDEAGNIKDIGVLVNTTPAGMQHFPDVSPLPLDQVPKVKWAVDIIYNPLKTPLLQQAEKQGAKIINGLYMLVAQAVKAQEIWNGITIQTSITESIYQEMKKRMAHE